MGSPSSCVTLMTPLLTATGRVSSLIPVQLGDTSRQKTLVPVQFFRYTTSMMMRERRCEECWAVLDPTKILRCTKCKACCYCSRECQTRNWRRLHKRVCASEPSMRPFIRVEMAVERVLKILPPMDEAPKGATCYICLDGEDGGRSSKLMRGCACLPRGQRRLRSRRVFDGACDEQRRIRRFGHHFRRLDEDLRNNTKRTKLEPIANYPPTQHESSFAESLLDFSSPQQLKRTDRRRFLQRPLRQRPAWWQ